MEGATRNLFRAAVAAYLNAGHPNIDYPLSQSQVVTQVNAALASGDRETILAAGRRAGSPEQPGLPGRQDARPRLAQRDAARTTDSGEAPS